MIKSVDYLIQIFGTAGLIIGNHRQGENISRRPSIVYLKRSSIEIVKLNSDGSFRSSTSRVVEGRLGMVKRMFCLHTMNFMKLYVFGSRDRRIMYWY